MRFILLLFSCLSTFNCAQGNVCETGWTFFGHTGNCYKFVPTRTSWSGAFSTCQSATSNPSVNLVSIPDKATDDFLSSKVIKSRWWTEVWTGGYRDSGQWLWLDGSRWTGYQNWYPGNPSGGAEDKLELIGSSGRGMRWNDGRNSYGRGAVCQYTPKTSGCNCGIANIPKRVKRVVGGSEAGEHKYPWMVRLVDIKNGGFCGGTLISSQHVLTAAHCVVKNGQLRPLSIFAVTLGEHDTATSEAERVSISKITPFPKYMVGHHVSHYDIAVLTLSSPVTFSRSISPVCLPADTQETHAGQDGITTGWGRTESGSASNVLKEADVKILTNTFCNEAYGATNRFISTEICAGTPDGASRRQGTCKGDSGGPLHVKENGRYAQVGVVSGSGSCDDPKIPDVFIRVGEASINKWIKEVATGTQDSNC